MRRSARWFVGLLGGLVLVFGLACLNYTKAEGLEHHREVARQHGWPPPDATIFYAGVGSVVVGATAVGFVAGRGRRQ
jgi:hypothetical protein